MTSYHLCPLEPRHDTALARVIRQTISEFVEPCHQQFTSMGDAQLDSLSSFYKDPQRQFWVIEDAEGTVWGGGGFAPLEKGPREICELQKMYFDPKIRGQGWGKAILQLCLKEAWASGFSQCYIETLGSMKTAQALYTSRGFRPISNPLGGTGHTHCDRFYIKDLP
ncbi:MAG: GNAT family N-acetyltransferase [Holophagaceae bacterium]